MAKTFPTRSISIAILATAFIWRVGIAQGTYIPLTLKQSEKSLFTLNGSYLRDATYSAAQSHHIALVSEAYRKANNEQRAEIVIGIEWADANHSLPQFEPLIRSFLKTSRPQDIYEDGRWNALQYLAKRCDQSALHTLMLGGASKGSESLMQFPISSTEWADTLTSFGKCNYTPARDVLTYSLNAASLNAAGAAYDSLQKLYPGLCKNVQSPEEAETCYLKQWSKREKSQSSVETKKH